MSDKIIELLIDVEHVLVRHMTSHIYDVIWTSLKRHGRGKPRWTVCIYKDIVFKRKKGKKIYGQLCEACSESPGLFNTVYRWIRRFADGTFEVSDDPRSEQPIEVTDRFHVEKDLNLLNEDRRLTRKWRVRWKSWYFCWVNSCNSDTSFANAPSFCKMDATFSHAGPNDGLVSDCRKLLKKI
jgi:hypothetical protein